MSGAHLSFPAALGHLVAQDPDAVAVVCDGRTLTRGQLDRASNRMAHASAALGVGPGDLVTIGLPNGLDWFVAGMAAWKLGAVPNPVSPLLPPAERQGIIDRADPSLVVGFPPDEVPGRTTLAGIVDDPTVPDGPLPDRIAPVERALTSGGSTGPPKLILSESPAVYDPGAPLALFTARQAMLVPGPLYHGIPFASAWRSLFAGALVVVMPRFDASACLELIERHGVDRVSFVPTMMQRIVRLPEDERAGRDVSSLEFVLTSGSPCPAWLMQAWIDWLGPEVMHESFGSTERIGGTFIGGKEWLAHPGSVGRPYAGSQAKILDPETGEPCATGVMGEIYWMPPEGPDSSHRYVGADRRVTPDGWESVGDMGYLDDEGYLYLGDRRGDMILCRGRNIYPAEIEAVLDAHPAVRSSAVVGLPDDDLGQSIHAVVEARGVTVDELRDHVRAHLVPYKVPGTVDLVDHPLRDDSGKVRRSAVRDAALARRTRS